MAHITVLGSTHPFQKHTKIQIYGHLLFFSYLDTYSQKLLLSGPCQTKTAPSFVCGGGSWEEQKAASTAGTEEVPAPGPQPLFCLAASQLSHPALGGLRSGSELSGFPERAGFVSAAGTLAERCCYSGCHQQSGQRGIPGQLEHGPVSGKLRLEETQTGCQADLRHSFPPEVEADRIFSTV